ncbi:MAG: hypothetical protein ISR69_00715 [Gammaproteobacteria bacterium]|nr:hypothetical protein [Gammaproteobacteria bacterium]
MTKCVHLKIYRHCVLGRYPSTSCRSLVKQSMPYVWFRSLWIPTFTVCRDVSTLKLTVIVAYAAIHRSVVAH